jgi:hypothetical protein
VRNWKTAFFVTVAVVVAGVAWAQPQDPKLTSTVVSELDPNEVTLSRNIGTSTEFIGRAAWRVRISNGAASALNRALFTAETFVVTADSDVDTPDAVATFEINNVIENAGTAGCSSAIATKLSCNFGDGQLAVGESAEFIVVVKTPTAGGRIKLRWTFGGDEGNGGDNGCCTKVAETYTALIDDASANSTVKTHVQSFMVKDTLNPSSNKVFTGTSGGAATAADPWTTVAELGTGYTVNGNPTQKYTRATVDEALNPSYLGSCSALNKNQCWLTQVTIPDTIWTTASPLRITLDRHSSIIKNGSKLSNYTIQYSTTPAIASSFATVPYCSADLARPDRGSPCIDACVEIPLPTSPPTFTWKCTIRALDNGGYKVP